MAVATPVLKGKEDDRSFPAFDQAKAAGSQAAGKAKEAVASVVDMAGNAATAVGQKADDLAGSAGTGIKKLAATMAEKSPHDGILGHASQAVAETIAEGGQYLEDAKLSGMADDVTKLIRHHPIPAILVGIGVGYILGRVLRS